MVLLSKDESEGLRNLARLKRKQRLRHEFMSEIYDGSVAQEQARAFFDDAFETIFTLPTVRDDELLMLCRIGYHKRQRVRVLSEFIRCEREQKWPGRALFLQASCEKLEG